MARFVIDAKTLLHVLERGRSVAAEHQLVAPASIRSQVMDLLLARVDAGDLTEKRALALHERLTETKLRLLNDRVSRRTAWDIARQHGRLTIRDAEYIALARLQADALVTIDADLADVATKSVPVAELDYLFQQSPIL
jgi:predicted nucleic acid-binding protein